MKVTRLFAILVALVSLAAATASSAGATTAEECQAELAELRAATVAAETSFANPKDFANTLVKLDEAAAKLAEGKNADAVAKLVDFQVRLGAFAGAPKPKLDPAVAQGLIAGAQTVVGCIDGLTA